MKHFFPRFLLVFLIGMAANGWLQAQKVQWEQPIDEVLSGSTIHYVGKNSHGYLFRDGSDLIASRVSRTEVGFFYVDDNQHITKTSDLWECGGRVIFARVTDDFIAIVTLNREGRTRELDIVFYDPESFKEVRSVSILKEFVRNVESFSVNIVESEDESYLLMSWIQVNRKSNEGELAFKVFDKDLKQVWETTYYPNLRVPFTAVQPYEFAISTEGVITALFGSYREKDRKTFDNYYIHISRLSTDGATTSSFKAPFDETPYSARAFYTQAGKIFVGAYYAQKFSAMLVDADGDKLLGSSTRNTQHQRLARIKEIRELPNGNIAVLGHNYHILNLEGSLLYTSSNIYIDITDPEARSLHSKVLARSATIGATAFIRAPFIHYDYFFKGNDIYLLYSSDTRNPVEVRNDKEKINGLAMEKRPKRGAFYIARINEAGQVQRKMMYDYKSVDSYFYPASYEIDEETLGVFRADRRWITPGKVSFEL